MKKVVDGKIYDTETAKKLFHVDNGLSISDFRNYDFGVYKTMRGNYFIAGEGGPMTMFARPCDSNSCCGGGGIIPITREAAREWAEHRNSDCSTDDIIALFEPEVELA